ncbi:MAG: acetyl-CoA carboxylase biotin carboxyl carrier protein [Myxococcales bacterium]|nr:acetyl-CoA carboxylase biotin carboxyl carrier protein [Myxococcales bacterium]
MSVDIDQLRSLLDLLGQKDVAEFEHEHGGERIRVVRGKVMVEPTVVAAAPRAAQSTANLGSTTELQDPDVIDVTSPFVGTFYRAPSPDTPPFIEIGTVIRPGQTLCIIEAMKLMNEIEAECSGTVTEIYAQNGKPVEFGQKLVRIKKA